MKVYNICLGAYFAVLFSLLLFINLYYLEGIPHVPDSAAYLFMAKMFALGHVTMPIPISPEHFNFFPGILFVEKGTWLFQYPFGHPLLLTIGILLGFPNIIPPLVGTLFVLFLFLITKKLFNVKTAFIAAILPVFSPFFLENASSFMSHNTASLYLIVSLYCLVIVSVKQRASVIPALLSGIFLGLLFNTRPLTALAFTPILVSIFFYQKHISERKTIFSFLAGFSCMLLLWLVYNYFTSGDLFVSQYYLSNKGMIGIQANEKINEFLTNRSENIFVLLNNLGPMLFNWPIIVTYGILLVPFLLRKNIFWDNIFFFSLFTLPIAYFFYDGQFLMYGPRFWYEILPFVFLLAARSFSLLLFSLPKITILIFFFLLIVSMGRLFGIIPTKDPDMMSPLALTRLRGINVVDSRIIKKVKRKNIHNAVVFIKDCQNDWSCYGSVFPQNSPKLDTDIVYAKNLGDVNNQTIFMYFRDRSFYRIDYNSLQLERINY